MARKKRRHEEEEHENHERWLVSYADFITLLFAFFVVMYSVSRVDNERLVQVSHAIRFALSFEGTGGVERLPIFQGPPTDGSEGISSGSGRPVSLTEREKARADRVRRRLENRLRPLLRDQPSVSVIVDSEGRRLIIRLSAARFFDSAEAVLHPEAIPILDAVAGEIVPLGNPIRIEGHTDERPIHTARFRNNWDLSASRAASVVAFLESAHGVPASRLAAVGYGSARPLSADDLEADRRVDIVVEMTMDDPLENASHDR